MPQVPPNRELVVYVLYLLGGESEALHTEDIALKCHELFKESFSWTKYPEYPDKDIVRVALTDARKDKHGAFVDGRSGQTRGQTTKTKRERAMDGWKLTPEGIQWVSANLNRLEHLIDTGEVKAHRQRILRQLKRITQHSLFDAFEDSPDRFAPSIGDIAALLRCRVDAGQQIWSKRFEAIRRKAEATEQAEVIAFLDKCEEAYLAQR